MELLPAIKKRFSVHNYHNIPIAQESIDRIIEAGRLAPSAKNRQPWRYVVIRSPQMKNRILQACYNEQAVAQAPVLIAICSTNIDYRMPNGQLAYPIDLTFGASFMCLQAVHEGLGCCINTTFDEEEIRELLTVPYSMRVVMLLTIGFSAEENPHEHIRFPQSRIVSYDHW